MDPPEYVGSLPLVRVQARHAMGEIMRPKKRPVKVGDEVAWVLER